MPKRSKKKQQKEILDSTQEMEMDVSPVEEIEELKEEVAVSRPERVLVLCTRGTAARYRHLMLDLVQLLPHCKKESKLDVKRDFKIVADIAEIKSCTSAVLFECRKLKDLYVWMSKTPSGPSIKFAAQNSKSKKVCYCDVCLV